MTFSEVGVGNVQGLTQSHHTNIYVLGGLQNRNCDLMTPMCMLPNDHHENYNPKKKKSNKTKNNTTKSHTPQEGQVRGGSSQISEEPSVVATRITFGPPELSRYAPAQVWQED